MTEKEPVENILKNWGKKFYNNQLEDSASFISQGLLKCIKGYGYTLTQGQVAMLHDALDYLVKSKHVDEEIGMELLSIAGTITIFGMANK